MGTLIINPTGVGNSSNLGVAGDTPAWKCVDDPNIPPSSPDADYVYEGSGTAYDTYQMANHTSETGNISNVRVYIRAKKVTSGSEVGRVVLRSGGTDYFGSATLGFVWQYHYTDWAQNPADSEDWEWSDIDALEAGVELTWISGNGPRCTQVYVEITYETPATEDATIDILIEQTSLQGPVTPEAFATISMGVSGPMEDATIKLGITNPENLEICTYDTTNSRWTNGAKTGDNKRYIIYISKLRRKEGLDILSELSFDLTTNDSDLYIEKGEIIALGTEFAWNGTPGNSTSQFYGDLFFEGIVTKVEKTIKVKIGSDYVQSYKVTSLHIVHTLASDYEQRLVSVRKCLWGGDEKFATPAWNIRDLLGDITYYDKTGTLITDVDDLPIYIRRCPTYISHKEYTDKNKLEILLDLCNQSSNTFYCHNDAFYFEPKKPSLGTAYFNQPVWKQGFRKIGMDAAMNVEWQESLSANSWDVEGGRYTDDYGFLGLPFRNTSPTLQVASGLGIWTVDTGSEDAASRYATISGKVVGTDYNTGGIASNYDGSIEGFQRNGGAWSYLSMTAKTQYIFILDAKIFSTLYSQYGISKPSGFFYPVLLLTDHASNPEKWIFRSGIAPSYYIIANDQMRFLNPLFPARFMIASLPFDGYQRDGWIMQGYNPINDRFCLSGIGLIEDETKPTDNALYSDYIGMFMRDYTHLTSLSNSGSVNSAIDEDERLIGWDDTIKDIVIDVEYTSPGVFADNDAKMGVIFNLGWGSDGLEDAIVIRGEYYTTGGFDYIMFYAVKVTNDVPSTINNDYTLHENVTNVKYYFRNDSSDCKVKVTYLNPANDTWYTVLDWTSMGVKSTGNGVGLIVKSLSSNEGIVYAHLYVDDEFYKTIDLDLSSKIKIKEPRTIGQYIVLGDQSETTTRVPIGKYPDSPATGDIKIVKKKVESDLVAKALARQLFETEVGKQLEFRYHGDLFDNDDIHFKIKPNKMIDFDGTDYFVTGTDTTFMDRGCTTKVTAGYKVKGYFEYLEETKKEQKIEQSRVTAPIMVEYETADISIDIIDEPKATWPDGDHYFIQFD